MTCIVENRELAHEMQIFKDQCAHAGLCTQRVPQSLAAILAADTTHVALVHAEMCTATSAHCYRSSILHAVIRQQSVLSVSLSCSQRTLHTTKLCSDICVFHDGRLPPSIGLGISLQIS